MVSTIVQTLRDLIDSHFKALRRRQIEVKHLTRQSTPPFTNWAHSYKHGMNNVFDDIPDPLNPRNKEEEMDILLG
jgi:hypothetical protein